MHFKWKGTGGRQHKNKNIGEKTLAREKTYKKVKVVDDSSSAWSSNLRPGSPKVFQVLVKPEGATARSFH